VSHESAHEQAEKFLAEAGQFRLGGLLTEASHPTTRRLSQTARISVVDALGLLFDVDTEVLAAYREWATSGAPRRISDTVRDALLAGGKIFFTGCGATGRLSILLESIWREFWSRPSSVVHRQCPPPDPLEKGEIPGPLDPWTPGLLVKSIMAGGDFALIKSVEGFEDFTQFGAKQIEDMGVSAGDVVFAITEGGETSFVIGTAWQGLKKGAKVYFVYNNPDDVLRENIIRSREVIEEPGIEKINLTTGPMAIMGSTRMQATSIQLCVMLTILEMVIRDLLGRSDSSSVPEEFAAGLEEMLTTLRSERVRRDFAGLVYLEETVYRLGRKSTYFANHLGIDVLTDTTERSPTFCTPAFRKWDDDAASESWTYLVLPYKDSRQAWTCMLKRPPRGLAWTDDEIQGLVGPEKAPRQAEIMKQIGSEEILRFRIGLDGLESRRIEPGDAVVCVIAESERRSLTSPSGFFHTQLERASASGAPTALIFLGHTKTLEHVQEFLLAWELPAEAVLVPLPQTNLLLDGITRVGAKMLLNALSTCTMVRLGRVLGNCMVAVVPSNLKLIDRSTRFVQSMTGLSYEDACRTLFEAIEYVRPRVEAGGQYPPVVGLSTTHIRDNCSFEEAEILLRGELNAVEHW
jgi:N-acetylmuramic acid 6-phosphate etherase